MKNSNTTTNNQVLSNKPIINTNAEVKNANNNSTSNKQNFSTADLWNIHKTVRTAYARRRVNTLMY